MHDSTTAPKAGMYVQILFLFTKCLGAKILQGNELAHEEL